MRWTQAGVPREIARRVAALDTLFAALDIGGGGRATRRPVADGGAASTSRSPSKLGLAWLRDRIGALPGDSHWQTLAKSAMRDDLAGLQRALADQCRSPRRAEGRGRPRVVARWEARERGALERAARLLGELRAAPAPDLAMLSVGLRELRNLA